MNKDVFEVYICKYDGDIVYIGEGVFNRHKHCNSGTSHVYELNKLHFNGFSELFDVKVIYVDTKEKASKLEKSLIDKYKPKFNKVYNSCSRGEQSKSSKQVKIKLIKYVDDISWNIKQKIKCKELINEFWDFYNYNDIICGNIKLLTKGMYQKHGKHCLLQLSRWLTSGSKKYSNEHYCRLFYLAYLTVYGVDITKIR